MIDYNAIAISAREKIRAYGREVTLIQIPSAAADPDRPWSAPDNTAEPITEVVSVVAVPPGGTSSFGLEVNKDDFLSKAKAVYITHPTQSDPINYHLLRDGTKEYKIEFVERLQPGPVELLYFIGVVG